MSRLTNPDVRWSVRYGKFVARVEELRDDLKQLSALDCEHPDATWSEYSEEAAGCVQGALFLLYQADRARADHIKRMATTPDAGEPDRG